MRGGGCGCGHGESNSCTCTKIYILRARLYHFIFVQSVIFGHTLCGLLNKLEGVVRWVCEEVGVGGKCGEVGVGRWVWLGGCG